MGNIVLFNVIYKWYLFILYFVNFLSSNKSGPTVERNMQKISEIVDVENILQV